MNGPPPPPGISAPRLGPLALNLRNQMLRKNTNNRLAALNLIGVSPAEPEKNLPRLSNLAPFPLPEPVLAPPSKLSAKAANWAPARPPLPPGPPPLPPGPPPMTSYVTTPYTMPSYTAPIPQPSLVPQVLIKEMQEGKRIFVNDYPAHLQTELKAIMQHYRFEYSISMHYRDGNSPSANPYYFIRKTVNRPLLRSMGQTQRRRRNKKRSQTRSRR
jgi:hypothetical protein